MSGHLHAARPVGPVKLERAVFGALVHLEQFRQAEVDDELKERQPVS